jgi:peroxiredoxin
MTWLSKLLGGRKMAALTAGTEAPQFELPAIDGSKFSLQTALTRGPVVAVFFKVSCPVCQYAFPYFERIYKTYGSSKVTIVAVSQNDRKETLEFTRRYGVTFPVLLDDTSKFPVSNAYRLTNVPTAFWIAEDGEIEVSSVGWAKKEFEEIARKAAAASGETPRPLFQASEQVADFRPG